MLVTLEEWFKELYAMDELQSFAGFAFNFHTQHSLNLVLVLLKLQHQMLLTHL